MKLWRIQGTPELETHASWDSYRAVEPEEPAREWPGYYWARGVDFWVRNVAFLIRECDVERAREGEPVDTFVPGLYGCADAADLLTYISHNIGGVSENDELYVALYEGDIIDRSEDGVVFHPRELLAIWPATDWIRAQEELESEGE